MQAPTGKKSKTGIFQSNLARSEYYGFGIALFRDVNQINCGGFQARKLELHAVRLSKAIQGTILPMKDKLTAMIDARLAILLDRL